MVAQGWEEGEWEMFNGYGVLLGEDKKVLEMDGSDSCLTMWMY